MLYLKNSQLINGLTIMRFLSQILFIFFCFSYFETFASSPPILIANSQTGLVLVHGTNDHREDAESYWSKSYIDNLSHKLYSNEHLLIIHCDFKQYMWKPAAAGCVSEQILQFIAKQKLTRLIIITHSDGGNIIRWILSNPAYDERYPLIIDTISYVVALAPSSNGTVLADMVINGSVFEKSLGWLLGYKSDSVRQQRTEDMQTYNQTTLYGTQGRPELPVLFYTVIGTNVHASPMNSDNYCGGYSYNLALKTTKLFLDSCSDGFLDCSSQSAAGNIWFYDKEKLAKQNTLNHNQSRFPCFGIGTLLKQLFV